MNQDSLQQSSKPASKGLTSPLITSQKESSFILQTDSGYTCHDDIEIPIQNTTEGLVGNIRPTGLNVLKQKNESAYLLMSEEDGLKLISSLSTTYSENNSSLQLAPEISRVYISGKDQNEERSPNIVNVNDSISIELPLLNNDADSSYRPNMQENTDHTNSTHRIANLNGQLESNMDTLSNQEQPLNLYNNLQVIFYKTPVFRILIVILGLSVLSGIISGFVEGNTNYTAVFPILYSIEAFFLLEQCLRIVHSYAPNRPNYSALFCGEVFYEFIDIIAAILITIALHIHLSATFGPNNGPLYFVIFLLSVYCACSKLPVEEKSKKFLFVVQVLGILLKVYMQIPLSWNVVLCFSWIFLTSLFLKLFEFFVQVLIMFAGDVLNRISKPSKAVTLIGIFLLALDLGASLVIVMVVCSLLDLEDDMENSLLLWLNIFKFFNLFVFLYAIATFKPLMGFLLRAVAVFNQRALQAREFVLVKQEVYLKKLSSTYYKIVEEINNSDSAVYENKEGETNENDQEADSNMCYICYGKTADGVIVDCGHGGICYDCLRNYVTLKDGCMECRREVTSVIKIETDKLEGSDIFKSKELYKIIKV